MTPGAKSSKNADVRLDGGVSLKRVERDIADMVEKKEGQSKQGVLNLEKQNRKMLNAILKKIADTARETKAAKDASGN